MLVLALAGGFAAVLLAAALIGIGSSVFHPEASRVARLASGGRYGFAQSLFQVGGNAGQAIGPLLVALLVIPNGQLYIAWFALAAVIGIVILSPGRASGTATIWRSAARPAARRLAPVAGRAQPGDRGGRDPAGADLLQELLHGGLRLLLQLLPDRPVRAFRCRQRPDPPVRVPGCGGASARLIGGPIGDRIGRKPILWISILGVLPLSLALPFVNLFWTDVLAVLIGIDHGLGLPGDHRLRPGAAAGPRRHDRRPVLRLRLRHGRHRRGR